MGGLRTFPTRITGTGRVKRVMTPVLRKPKAFKAEYPGHCLALDTVELWTRSGERWYIVTAEDIYTRTAFAFLTRSHASLAARAILTEVQARFPHVIDIVLTDNGSEFKKHFAQEVRTLAMTHYHTYPHTPKMNAHIERFNRTLQEEFTRYHMGLLLVDRTQFEMKLEEYLRFYNTDRVHHAFKNLQSPYQFMVQREQLVIQGREVQKGVRLYRKLRKHHENVSLIMLCQFQKLLIMNVFLCSIPFCELLQRTMSYQ